MKEGESRSDCNEVALNPQFLITLASRFFSLIRGAPSVEFGRIHVAAKELPITSPK